MKSLLVTMLSILSIQASMGACPDIAKAKHDAKTQYLLPSGVSISTKIVEAMGCASSVRIMTESEKAAFDIARAELRLKKLKEKLGKQ